MAQKQTNLLEKVLKELATVNKEKNESLEQEVRKLREGSIGE